MKKVFLILLCLSISIASMGCTNNDSNTEKNQAVSSGDTNSNSNSGKEEQGKESEENNATLKGNVTEINGKTISVRKVIEKDNGTIQDAQPGDKDSGGSFKVLDNTKIIIRTIEGKGDSQKDSNGSISDIKNDSRVDVWGDKEGDIINATKVVVYKFK